MNIKVQYIIYYNIKKKTLGFKTKVLVPILLFSYSVLSVATLLQASCFHYHIMKEVLVLCPFYRSRNRFCEDR